MRVKLGVEHPLNGDAPLEMTMDDNLHLIRTDLGIPDFFREYKYHGSISALAQAATFLHHHLLEG
jgi:hypothetical protein